MANQMFNKSLTSEVQGPSKPPSKEILPDEPNQPSSDIVSKKLFIVSQAPPKQLPSVDKACVPETQSSATLPPKPIRECRPPLGATTGQENPTGYFHEIGSKLKGWYDSLTSRNWNATCSSQLPNKANMVLSGSVAFLRRGAIVTWNVTISTVRNTVYWIGVFLNSREYFYLRYYTLLFLENAVHYSRRGLSALIRSVRDLKGKK
ncbi:uncharacterized protein LOC129723992 isoform X3 [Wyeomyia smithii]|uniref:uncharacterized protein LOC129723992 isoform X3 n=1 Tax=Wyeomyia smithii TaxID=174621 RepID=UPI0024680C52|nr:uncharacterized protein LOC129723992 isoform X3 [Wyeomyia smithii]